jgi:hypothetical protein
MKNYEIHLSVDVLFSLNINICVIYNVIFDYYANNQFETHYFFPPTIELTYLLNISGKYVGISAHKNYGKYRRGLLHSGKSGYNRYI